jgi:hypothetical protein
MPTINPTLPNDGETIDASDVNGPFAAIIGLINGNLNAISLGNIADGLITPQKLTVDLQAAWQAPTSSFAYLAANQITVSAADALNIGVGTKLKFTQTTLKYFYVIAISGTTVTITGGSDYTLANAAITTPFISNAFVAAGFPKTFAWTPTVIGWSSTTVAQYRFRLQAGRVTLYIYVTGVSNSGSTSITLPIPPDVGLTFYEGVPGLVIDNGSPTGPGRYSVDNSSGAATVVGFFTNFAGSNFIASGTKSIRAVVIYEA